MKRSAFLFGALILLFAMTACGNRSPQNSSQAQASSSQIQSSAVDQPQQSSSAAPSSENAVSSAAVQSQAPVSSAADSSAAVDSSPQTEPEAWKQVKAALNTKVPLMLPTGLPIAEGGYLTATTVSEAQNYKVNLYEGKQPAAINSKADSQGTLLATVEGTEYPDASSAKDSISAYEKIDTSGPDDIMEDLGHNIKAMTNAGLGHQQLIWNEGRWCLWVDSPTDPAFKNKEYPDRSQLAKDVVAYLEQYMLPAPQDIGVIFIGDWDGNKFDNATTVKLQKNKVVYQITCNEPMEALKIAVAMKLQ